MSMVRGILILSLLLVWPPGCSSSPESGGVQHDLAGTSTDLASTPRTYVHEVIAGCPRGGLQTQMAAAPDGVTVGLMTISQTTKMGTCTPVGRQPEPVPLYDLCFAEWSGTAWKAATVSTEAYIAPNGVALAYAPDGSGAAVAYNGNARGVPPAMFRCGASNLLLVTGKGGQFGAPRAVATSSQSAALVPDQASTCIQNVCNSGDAVGYWPAVSFPGGAASPAVAYRDLHFGFAMDDFASSDVEYAPGPGFSILTVDVARGGGSYNHLGFRSGLPVIAHYNGERNLATDGVWVDRDSGGGKWTSTRISEARVGEVIGFAVSAAGVVAVAYHDADDLSLKYLESHNGSDWSRPEVVDNDGVTGQFPALAFGPDQQPAIAYYRCRDYDPGKKSCDSARDGLMLARRGAGGWSSEKVVARAGVTEGMYPALAFSRGKAVIAYQSLTFDPGSNSTTVALEAAREQ